MTSYLEKLHLKQIRFPKASERFLYNLFYMVECLKDEENIRLDIFGGFEKYRDCVKTEGLKGITLSIKWEQDEQGYRVAAHHAEIKPHVLLAQLVKYCSV